MPAAVTSPEAPEASASSPPVVVEQAARSAAPAVAVAASRTSRLRPYSRVLVMVVLLSGNEGG
ncbi:hypothetical protein M877_01980 [Streptomyces niveus NCIMB 11891]|nr:hypothetical protein M877_01980 [Streptomyces niveus NCIMB 11891]